MTSVEPTTDVPTPTGSGGSTGGTTGSPGADLAGLQESCERFCDSALACLKPNPYPDLASCVWLCVDTFDAEQPVCVDAYIEANNCLGGLECPGFIDALTGGQGACSASQAEIQEVCQPACKWAFVDGGPATCSIGQTCPVGPPSAYECNGATCACNVDGEVQKECPADGLCGQGWEAQVMAANACCGFDF
jgi:hypothetical protein